MIKTISYLKSNISNLNLQYPLIVTQNGLPVYVINSYENFNKTQETIALLKLLILSEKDKSIGKTYKKDELFK